MLQHLRLDYCKEVNVAVLPRLATLQHVTLMCCDFTCGVGGNASTTLAPLEGIATALLEWLSACVGLRHLDLYKALEALAPDPSAYSALTASSHLTHLDLICCRLPAGVRQWLLPTGRLLPQLCGSWLYLDRHLDTVEAYGNGGAVSMDSLVCSCPALHALHWRGSRRATAFAALRRLPRLRRLAVGEAISSAE